MCDRVSRISVLALGFLWLIGAPTWGQTKLLRFPDIHGDQVAFSYAGDIWLAPASGGAARRLTAHPGLELFPRYSPDGQWIAFTGQYDGDEQVYVVPVTGGAPRQLTYYPAQGPLPPRWGYDHQVYGWSPDGKSVLFRSLRDGWDLSDGRLYTIALDGGLPTALPMPQSGAGDFSPDGRQIVYSPLFRDFRHWKRYQGGWAQDLFIFDLESHELEQVTDHVRSDRDPMWIGDKIYFSSDRSGTLNLYVYDLTSKRVDQLTRSDVWDVRWPSADPARRKIVYELDGELQVWDIAAATSTPIRIFVPTDAVAKRPGRVSAAGQIEGFDISPKGLRAVFAARGDIFTAPAEHGPTRHLTPNSASHDREPAWSPDGSQIAYVSDLAGEEEIYLVPQDGRAEPRKLTDGSFGRLQELSWAPDGRWIAFRDQRAKLFLVEVDTGEVTELADDPTKYGLDYAWSPHGGFLAFSLSGDSGFRSIQVWSRADRRVHRVTSELTNDFSPSWDPEGKYLFFISDREYTPQIGSVEFNYVVDRESHIYALALRKDVEHPFPPRSDEVVADDGEEDDEDAEEAKGQNGKESTRGDKEKEKDAEKPIDIDFDGLAERVARVPLPAENYGGVEAVKGHLLILEGGATYYGRSSDREPEIKIFSMEKREAKTLASSVQAAAVSADGSKVMVQSAGQYQILDATMGGQESAKTVSTAALVVYRVPEQEWAQIFDEVWRRFRDFFYVENMHGYDWQALRERYEPWLRHVGHRSDLNYLISEMISELNVSHTYVTGGDWETPERPAAALLGARFELDPDAGRYRFTRILFGDNAEDRYRAPLTEVGVEVELGDYLLAVNGIELAADDNPYRLLRPAGGGVVELTVNASPALEGARYLTVRPIDSEDNLIYLDWIEGNRRYVAEKTQDRVGYLHLPDMGVDGIQEWIKWFYPQIRKEGLVIDVRSNGGGNVSPMLIERLRRRVLMIDFERNYDLPDPSPGAVFIGHLVCLLDEDTASDGDQFAYLFREAGLGPLIGKRSWGGVVGIYPGSLPLVDGGIIMVPEAGTSRAEDGSWVIEGHGVEPDIVVENEPKALLAGRDQQLDKAIEVLLKKMETEPRRFPERPPPPVKTD